MVSRGKTANQNGLATLPRELALLSTARQALAEARTIHEVKDIRDKAEAVRMYLRAAGESLEAQNAAAEVKLWAERRGGEMLVEIIPHEGGRPKQSHDASVSLESLGVLKDQSSRWQKIAGIDAEAFDQHIESVKADGKELTTASVLRLATPAKDPQPWTLDEAIGKLDKSVRDMFAKWPAEFTETMGHKLRSLGDELLEVGRL